MGGNRLVHIGEVNLYLSTNPGKQDEDGEWKGGEWTRPDGAEV